MFASNCPLSTNANTHYPLKKGEVRTFRVFVKPQVYGSFLWRFQYSNTVDSTWADGSFSYADLPGGHFCIRSAAVGIADENKCVSEFQPVTLGGDTQKEVSGGEVFYTDPVHLTIRRGQYLAFSWCIESLEDTAVLPGTPDSQALAYIAEGEHTCADLSHFRPRDEEMEEPCVMPCLFEADRPVSLRMGFLGDSITQGCCTRTDHYEQWAVRIALGADKNIAFTNLGLGYARAQDAARDGAWLRKTENLDAVNVCLGVNDMWYRTKEALLQDLTSIVSLLKGRGKKVILFTVPPFDLEAQFETKRKWVNERILKNTPGADFVFDFAALLCHDAPNDHLTIFGGHPDGRGGALAAGAYLSHFLPQFLDSIE